MDKFGFMALPMLARPLGHCYDYFLQVLDNFLPLTNDNHNERKRLVIIGSCGFAGIETFILAYGTKRVRNAFDFIGIDSKSYFEYSPGMLEALCAGEKHFKEFSFPIYSPSLASVEGDADQNATEHEISESLLSNQVLGRWSVAKKAPKLLENHLNNGAAWIDTENQKVHLKDGTVVPYDLLVIASGSAYESEIKYTSGDDSFASRCDTIEQTYEAYRKAEKIWVKGAGGVGVELAAEMAYRLPPLQAAPGETPPKREIVLEYRNAILSNAPESARKYVIRWMERNGVRMVKSDDVSEEDRSSANVHVQCHTWKANTGFLPDQLLDEKKQVIVDDHLRVKGLNNVFAIGDCVNTPESKIVGVAQFHARFFINNLDRTLRGKAMNHYSPTQKKNSFTLGPRDGLAMTKNYVILKGWLSSVAQRILKRVIVNRMSILRAIPSDPTLLEQPYQSDPSNSSSLQSLTRVQNLITSVHEDNEQDASLLNPLEVEETNDLNRVALE